MPTLREMASEAYSGNPQLPGTRPPKDKIVAIFDAVDTVVAEHRADIDEALSAALANDVGMLPPVRVVATTNINLATGAENGDTIDGVVMATGQSWSATGQTDQTQNGVYIIQASGAAVRATYADTGAELAKKSFTVDAGTHAGETWYVETTPITIGVTNIVIKKVKSADSYGAEVATARDAFSTLNLRLDDMTAKAATAQAAADSAATAEAIKKAFARLEGIADGFCILARERTDAVLVIKDSRSPNGRFTGLLRNKATVTRTGTAYYCNRDGVYIVAQANELRIHYDFATQEPLGILRENGATNVLLHANDFTQAAWTKSNVTATKNQVGPDGVAASACSIAATATNGTVSQAVAAANARRTQSVFVKRLTGSGTLLFSQDNGTTETDITPTGTGWERKAIFQTLTNPTCRFKISVNGDSFAVWCAQNEAGSSDVATSPMPSGASAFVRGAETVALAAAALLGWSATEGTVYCEARTDGLANTTRYAWVAYSDANNYIMDFLSSALTPAPGRAAFQIQSGGVLQANVTQATALASGSFRRQVGLWKANQVNFAQDGAIGVLDAAATMPATALANFYIGSTIGGAGAMEGTIGEMVYIAKRLTDDQGTTLSLNGFDEDDDGDDVTDTVLPSGITTAEVWIGLGQSWMAGSIETPAAIVNNTADPSGRVLMPKRGVRMDAAIDGNYVPTSANRLIPVDNMLPLIGAVEKIEGGLWTDTPMSRFGNLRAAYMASSFLEVVASMAVGSMNIEGLGPGKFQQLNAQEFVRQVVRHLGEKGVTCIARALWVQGHGNRNASGNADTTYKDNFKALATSFDAAMAAITGQEVVAPIYFVQTTEGPAGVSGTANDRIPLGQIQAALESDLLRMLCPSYVLAHIADGIHWTRAATGEVSDYLDAALRWQEANSLPWKPLYCTSAVLSGSNLDLTFNVPVGPIQLLTSLVSNPGDYGIVLTGGSPPAISSVSVLNSTTIRVALGGAWTTGNKVDLGWRVPQNTPGGPTTGARTCICDSQTRTGAAGQTLRNYAALQEITVT